MTNSIEEVTQLTYYSDKLTNIDKLVDQLEIDIQCHYDVEYNYLLAVVEKFIESYRSLQEQ